MYINKLALARLNISPTQFINKYYIYIYIYREREREREKEREKQYLALNNLQAL